MQTHPLTPTVYSLTHPHPFKLCSNTHRYNEYIRACLALNITLIFGNLVLLLSPAQTKYRAPTTINSPTHVEHTHICARAYMDECTSCTCTRTQITFLLFTPLGRQSPASAAKLPKLSHLLMGYLSPCVSAILSTLMSFCLSVCLCAFLNV